MRIWLLMVYLIVFVHTVFGQKIVSFLPVTHTETAVIVCSGGSYFWSANETESDSVARTLRSMALRPMYFIIARVAFCLSSPIAD